MNGALARDQSGPQILRIGRLSGGMRTFEDPDLLAEFRATGDTIKTFLLNPGSPPDARARRWQVRRIYAFASRENFDGYVGQVMREEHAMKPSNVETKILVRSKIEGVLAPMLITDRDVIITFDDAVSSFRWGFRFQGQQYRAHVERWFDDLWASIPDSYLIYSRNGFNERAIDRIKK